MNRDARNRRLPDFFIVGAWKAGTTSMHRYLNAHPDVFMCEPKEPHFFGSDMTDGLFCTDPDRYLALFADAGDAKRVGEASTSYLYSRAAAREIRELCGEVDIVIMLRNPVDMVYAHHGQRVFHGAEPHRDFRKALDAEDARRRGEPIPGHARPREWLFYRKIGRYAEQVQRYFDLFGRDRVHVILFDDFVRDTPGTYGALLRFLGVDETFRPSFEVRNPARTVRSTTIREWLLSPPSWLRRVARLLVPSRRARAALADRILETNTVVRSRPPLPHDVRLELQREFAPDVERLGTMLGRDLSHWTGGG